MDERLVTMKPNSNSVSEIGILLILLLLIQRIAVPFYTKQVPAVFIVLFIYIIYCILQKKVFIDIYRFILLIISISSILIVSILCQNYLSYFSLLYLLAIYFPFIYFMNITSHDYKRILILFQRFMVTFSVIGIVQIALEFVGVPYFDFFSFLPEAFVQMGYNTSYPIVYGSAIYKSNAIIFLEPSFYSQILALSLLVEIVYFRKMYRITIYLLALASTFAGTGLIMLFITIPFWLRYVLTTRSTRLAFVGGLLLVVLSIIMYDTIRNDNYYLNRLNEFSSEGSSANIRFIAPYGSLAKIFSFNSPWLGLGAGAVTNLSDTYLANYPVFPKLVIEYGVIAGGLFTIFLIYCFFSRQRSFIISLACAVMFFFLSGSLLQPQIVYLLFLLTIFTPVVTVDKSEL